MIAAKFSAFNLRDEVVLRKKNCGGSTKGYLEGELTEKGLTPVEVKGPSPSPRRFALVG